nr:hypothetical protein [Desulfobacterales bacterium]
MLEKGLDRMEKKFKSPPREYSPQVWWFWNGDMQEEKINWQLQEMVHKGVYGAFMHARPGLVTPYLSDRWWEVVGYTIKRAKELGFYAWIYDEYAWPSGTAGSPYKCSPQPFSKVLAEGEKNYAKGLRYLEKRVKGPGRIRINFPQSMGKLECIIVAKSLSLNSIDVESLSELPRRLNFDWEVPSGDWVIIAFFSYVVEDRVDYLNPQTIAKFIEVTHEEYYKRYAQYFNSTVPGVFFDEIHNDGRPFVWTDRFLEKFEAIKGYDLRKYLPLLIYEGGDITDKIRCDYFDVVTALYEKAWFKQIGDWCERHRIKLTGHTEEWLPEQALSQGDYFRTMRHLQIPGTDNHCFRYRYPRRVDPIESKVISSVAHLAAKERVVAEAMGGAGWAITPQMLKYGADMLYVFGVNMLVPHGFFYTMDSPSAMDDWPHSWFYQNPYWKYFKIYADYISRLSYMLSGGKHICDIAVLYPITSIWTNIVNGKPTSVAETISSCYHDSIRNLLKKQLDLDVIDECYLLESDVEDGKINVSNEAYSVLILPPLTTIRRDTISKIRSFYEAGGKIIGMKFLPQGSLEQGRNDPKVIQEVKDIFGLDPSKVAETNEDYILRINKRGGKAYFIRDEKVLPELVCECINRDIIITKGDPSEIYYLHRQKEGKDIYFVVN